MIRPFMVSKRMFQQQCFGVKTPHRFVYSIRGRQNSFCRGSFYCIIERLSLRGFFFNTIISTIKYVKLRIDTILVRLTFSKTLFFVPSFAFPKEGTKERAPRLTPRLNHGVFFYPLFSLSLAMKREFCIEICKTVNQLLAGESPGYYRKTGAIHELHRVFTDEPLNITRSMVTVPVPRVLT